MRATTHGCEIVWPLPIGSGESSYARIASASSTKMWRGTAFIAESTASSRMPSVRSRSIIRARVRSDVMPLPLVPLLPAPGAAIIGRPVLSGIEPRADAAHLLAIGEVDLQRRHRNPAVLDGVEIGPLARVGRRARGADPVDRFAARALHAHDVLGLVPASEPRDPITLHVLARDVGNVDVQEPRAGGLALMPQKQVERHAGGGLEMLRRLRRE